MSGAWIGGWYEGGAVVGKVDRVHQCTSTEIQILGVL